MLGLYDSVDLGTSIDSLRSWRICLTTVIVLLAVGRFGIWVWPEQANVAVSTPTPESVPAVKEKPPKQETPKQQPPKAPQEKNEISSSGLGFKEVSPEQLGILVPDIFVVRFATNTATVFRKVLKKQVPFEQILGMKFPGSMPLKIYFNQHGQMKVDATIFEADGVTKAAVIKHSDFVVIAKAKGWDRNWDATGFEIVDAEKHPFFQIERLGENVIKLGGLFRMTDGSLIVINDREFAFLGKDRIATTPITTGNPLFAYPSKDNLHVRSAKRS